MPLLGRIFSALLTVPTPDLGSPRPHSSPSLNTQTKFPKPTLQCGLASSYILTHSHGSSHGSTPPSPQGTNAPAPTGLLASSCRLLLPRTCGSDPRVLCLHLLFSHTPSHLQTILQVPPSSHSPLRPLQTHGPCTSLSSQIYSSFSLSLSFPDSRPPQMPPLSHLLHPQTFSSLRSSPLTWPAPPL